LSHEIITPAGLPARLDALEAAVRARTDLRPRVGIVLGSGLGGLAMAIEEPVAIPFADLPGWPAASAPGHAGRLLLGRIEGVPVVCLEGRLHLYEGHAPGLIVQPVLLMGRLGAGTILLSNAAGSVNVAWPAGTLMAISDHLNLTGTNPLLGPNADALGRRFPDLTDAWSPRLRALLHDAAAAEDVVLEDGVYAGLLGPNYETPAEVRMLRTLGADAVGMSTVLEAIAARWAGLDLAGVTLVTNPGAGITGERLSHAEVLAAADAAAPRFERLVRRWLSLLASSPN
jgi:purine-nucleoside phosphorylase